MHPTGKVTFHLFITLETRERERWGGERDLLQQQSSFGTRQQALRACISACTHFNMCVDKDASS